MSIQVSWKLINICSFFFNLGNSISLTIVPDPPHLWTYHFFFYLHFILKGHQNVTLLLLEKTTPGISCQSLGLFLNFAVYYSREGLLVSYICSCWRNQHWCLGRISEIREMCLEATGQLYHIYQKLNHSECYYQKSAVNSLD